ncbi:hypothetical protein LKL35_36850 [Streptomyces sp. ET3-23]|uniref:hypothetical protein n=1 Tax=Streptomyces sp. ET3-23 TaxID=2885643 RepID=UPI001D10EB5D|nr:hypothetical protein [Streptomyces sp. ET3-23]MCC2280894.1 hypothetical protein [Streptomyces sp. ET3-23]
MSLPPRVLCCFEDGTIRDHSTHLRVPLDDLVKDPRDGRRFTAHEHPAGTDCTYRVLAGVLATAVGRGMRQAQHALTGRSGWSRQ